MATQKAWSSFNRNLLTDNTDYALGAFAVDIDDFEGDGDPDIVTTATGGDIIAWWEQRQGPLRFETHDIVTTGIGTSSLMVQAIDFDRDSDTDVVGSLFAGANKFVWYEQGADSESFSERTIGTTGSTPGIAQATDFDDDGDVDLVAPLFADNELAWYEQTANPTTFTKHSIDGVSQPREVKTADMDDDGDLDILVAINGGDAFHWYEQTTNSTTYDTHVIDNNSTHTGGAFDIKPGDFDCDGRMDVVTAANGSNKFAWYEQTSDSTVFNRHIIEDGGPASGANEIHPIDFDGDGDSDVVTSAGEANEFAWYENGGNPESGQSNFTRHVIEQGGHASGANDIQPVDLGDDGDFDVVTASGSPTDEFNYYIQNRAPSIDNPVGRQTTQRNADTFFVDLNGRASDPESDALKWVVTGDGDTVEASVEGVYRVGGNDTLAIRPKDELAGTETLTLSVGDGFDTVSQTFDVAVEADEWYVNDGSTMNGDSWTTAVGNDANAGSSDSPYRTVTKASNRATANDTIYVDAGTFSETVALTADGLSLLGVDSGPSGTVMDFGDSSGVVGARGIFSQGTDRLFIRDLRVTGSDDGILLDDVQNSRIQNVTINRVGIGLTIKDSPSNEIISNVVTESRNNGFFVDGNNGAQNNLLVDNVSSNNGANGFQMSLLQNNTLRSNQSLNNGENGFELFASQNNTLIGNVSANNASNGFNIRAGVSSDNTLIQNTADSNAEWEFQVDQFTSNNTITKNNILPAPTTPDSGLINKSSNSHEITRNWWNTRDTTVIGRRAVDSVNSFTPFRLGQVDTAPGADTVAPAAPDTVATSSPNASSTTISWAASTGAEESGFTAGDLDGYRVYRGITPDTNRWQRIADVEDNVLEYTDSGHDIGDTFFYRVTAYDNHDPENESFYADTTASGTVTAATDTGNLQIRSLEASPDTISNNGSDTVAISWIVENIGSHEVSFSSSQADFSNNPSGNAWTRLSSTLPDTVASSETVAFQGEYTTTSTAGLVTVDGRVEGTDPVNGATVTDKDADDTAQVLVQEPGLATVRSLSTDQDTYVMQDGADSAVTSDTLRVTITLENTGTAKLDVDAETDDLAFTNDLDRTITSTFISDTVTPDTARVASGETVALNYTFILPDSGVFNALGPVTVDAKNNRPSGTDVNSGADASDPDGADTTVNAILYRPFLSGGLTLTSAGRISRATIPAGKYPNDADLTIIPTPASSCIDQANSAVATNPDVDRFNSLDTSTIEVLRTRNEQQSNRDIDLTLTYNDADVPADDRDDIRVFRLNESTCRWEAAQPLDSQVQDVPNRDVTAQVTGFSVFRTLVGTLVPPNLANFRIAPNPYRPNDGNPRTGQAFDGTQGTGIYFLNVPAQVRISIYTIHGEEVTTFTTNNSGGQIQWDTRNDHDELVASGYYLYRIEQLNNNGSKQGKLAIIR